MASNDLDVAMSKKLADDLEQITKNLDKFREGTEFLRPQGRAKRTGSASQGPSDPQDAEQQALGKLLTQFRDLLGTVIEELAKTNDKSSGDPKLSLRVAGLEKRSRRNEDSGDHHHQRSLKGKLLISSTASSAPLMDRDGLKEAGKTLPTYVCELIKKKFALEANENDIFSCAHSRNGISVRFVNLSPGTTFSKLVDNIKTGQGREVKDVYFNFALTPRRASLMYELRQLRKSQHIEKALLDFDGTISYVRAHGGNKEKITSLFDREDKVLFTLTPMELKNKVFSGQPSPS